MNDHSALENDRPWPEPAATRRGFLRAFGAGAGALALVSVVPQRAKADTLEVPDQVAGVLEGAFGVRQLLAGKVTLELPIIAETGISVPITFRVDSPMTETDYVKRILGFATGNPELVITDYLLTPRSGKAEVSTRIRLQKTQQIYAAAQMSDGTVWGTNFNIIVTFGACFEDIWDMEKAAAARRNAMRAAADAADAAAAAGR